MFGMRTVHTYPSFSLHGKLKTKQHGMNWGMRAQKTWASLKKSGLPPGLASSGITFQLQHYFIDSNPTG